jgi:carbon-monoxide dehydrogenase large subunit
MGCFRVADTDRAVSLKDTAHAAHVPSRLPEGLKTRLHEVASFSPEIPNFPDGSHVCEVEIDPETGITGCCATSSSTMSAPSSTS